MTIKCAQRRRRGLRDFGRGTAAAGAGWFGVAVAVGVAVAMAAAVGGCRPRPAEQGAAAAPGTQGGGSAAPVGAGGPERDLDACIHLTYSDAEAIAGRPLRRMKTWLDQESGESFAKCSYGDPSLLGKTVSIEMRRHASAEEARRVQEAARSQVGRLAAGEVFDIEGLGDAAFWADYRVDQLHALAGDVRMIVTATIGEEAERRPGAEAVARRTIDRLAGRAPAAPAPTNASP